MFAIAGHAHSKPHQPRRRLCVLLLSCLVLSLAGCSRSGDLENPSLPEIALGPNDRVLILAPHPDDEVIGCAGVIQSALARKLPLHIVFLTYGDGNQWAFMIYRRHPVVMPDAVRSMGMLRHDEALAAARSLGVPQENLTFLGYPDSGTLNIWQSHWGDRPADESVFTRVRAVPYPNAFRPGAAYKGEEILRDLETILRRFQPTKLFVSHPADDHPDHKALYLFARVALWDLGDVAKPVLYPYMVHRWHWPAPQGFHPDAMLAPPKLSQENVPWQSCRLKHDQIECKHAALLKHRSQYDASATYLLSFVRANELFGDLPVVALRPDASSQPQALERRTDSLEIPDGLVDEERLAFVGVLERSLSLENGNLSVSVTLSRPVGEAVGVSVYVFGYRRDRAFADMPKLHVRFDAFNHEVYDQDKRLPRTTVELTRVANQVRIRLPLETLGNPERVMTSVRTYLSAVPLDCSSWRILELTGKEDAETLRR
jgi:LmbE family N-acetylglucosaminyl deacetylase